MIKCINYHYNNDLLLFYYWEKTCLLYKVFIKVMYCNTFQKQRQESVTTMLGKCTGNGFSPSTAARGVVACCNAGRVVMTHAYMTYIHTGTPHTHMYTPVHRSTPVSYTHLTLPTNREV